MKRLFAILLAVVMVLGLSIPAMAADGDYKVKNPYEKVIWGEWKAYKANLHTHTTFSDGHMTLDDVIEEYYKQDSEVLASTDHGVVSETWDKPFKTTPPFDIQNWFNGERTVLSSDRLKEITDGVGRESKGIKGMIQVPKGIEMNAAVPMKSHVNGFFAGWGYYWVGIDNDYRTAIRMTEKRGGVSFINHPGDWAEDAKDPVYAYHFMDILNDYPSCLGIEIYNRVDSVTRDDRILWDNMLMRSMPNGRPILAFSNDDSHRLSDIGGTAETMYMPANTVEEIRKCMETGAFLAGSRRDKHVLGEDFVGDFTKPFPTMTNLTIAADGKSITIETADTDKVEWVADGKVVATGNSIDLTIPEVTCYVRAQMIGPGGISTTQAFAVDKGDNYKHEDDSLKGFDRILFYTKLYLRKNIVGLIIEELIDLFKDLGK